MSAVRKGGRVLMAVVEALQKQGPSTSEQLASATGLTLDQVREAIRNHRDRAGRCIRLSGCRVDGPRWSIWEYSTEPDAELPPAKPKEPRRKTPGSHKKKPRDEFFKLGALQRAILSSLIEHGPQTISQLAERLVRNHRTVHSSLDEDAYLRRRVHISTHDINRMGDWSPVFAAGAGPDAPMPDPVDAEDTRPLRSARTVFAPGSMYARVVSSEPVVPWLRGLV